MPTVTVIIPTFNRARFLPRCLTSILQQVPSPDQIIVVDDGSSDHTRSAVSAFSGSVQYMWQPNRGKASALNAAMPKATGSAVWIFDDDDVAAPGGLKSLSDALDQHPKCGFSYGSYFKFTGDLEFTGADEKSGLTTPQSVPLEDLLVSQMESCTIFQPGMLVRKCCYDELGPFREDLLRSQDYEMLLRIARHYPGVDTSELIFFQRQHEGVRGPATLSASGAAIDGAWRRFDQIIFTELYNNLPLEKYVRAQLKQETSDLVLAGLAQRCCIMARKGLWQLAARDLSAFSEGAQDCGKSHLSAGEALAFSRILEGRTYADDIYCASDFHNALNKIEIASLKYEIRLALLRPVLREIRRRLARGRFSRRLWRSYFSVGTPAAIIADLGLGLFGSLKVAANTKFLRN